MSSSITGLQSFVQEKLQLLIAENRRLEMVLANHRETRKLCCYHCGSPSLKLEGSFNDSGTEYHIWECMACGLAQLEEHLAEEVVKDLEDTNPYYELPTPEEIEDNVTQHSFILDLIHQYRSGARMLEIGCSLGYKLEAARRHGWEVEGIDLSPRACAFVGRTFGIPVHEGTLDSYIPQRSFDAIVAWHVLEHAPSVQAFLSHIYTFLSSGGHLFLQVPSYARFRELEPWTDQPENFTAVHNWHFTQVSLSHQLMENHLAPLYSLDDEALRFLTFVATRD